MMFFIRVTLIVIFVPIYIFMGLLFSTIPISLTIKYKLLTSNVSLFSKLAIKIINIKMIKNNQPAYSKGDLIVANHLSYIDILLLAAISPCIFVASFDLDNNIFLKILAKIGGSVFVNRRDPTDIRLENQKIANFLQIGFNVVLFPEATSSSGEKVLHFKSALFESAILAKAKIIPTIIQYVFLDKKPIDLNNRDNVCWHGAMRFFPHFIRLLKCKEIIANISVAEPIIIGDSQSRKEIASRAHASISKIYNDMLFQA